MDLFQLKMLGAETRLCVVLRTLQLIYVVFCLVRAVRKFYLGF